MLSVNTMLNSLFDLIFPVHCLSCGSSGSDFCINCLAECPTAERETAKWIFPVYDYRHPPIRKALSLLKYKGKKRLAKIFAQSLYENILEELSDLSVMENFTDPILIPIPLSKPRLRRRGYNQAELMCSEILKLNSLRHGVDMQLDKNILLKPIETGKYQALIHNRAERLRNAIGAFALAGGTDSQNKIKDRNIILIDDITTTGATLSEARKILKSAGARKVIAFTVAH